MRPRAVLLDIDGVLYVEDQPIAGAFGAVDRLRELGLTLRFVTNTTSRSRASTLSKLRSLGFDVSEPELITPAALAVQVCRTRGHRRVAVLVAPDVRADFAELDLSTGEAATDAVIVGDLGESWDYATLNRAFRLIFEGADLIALQKNRFWLRTDGLSLDVGPFVAALEYATGRVATVVGKPASDFFAAVLAGAGVTTEESVMVGDDVESDIGGALDAGVSAILVRTGKYRHEFVEASGIKPTATVDSIVDVPDLLAAGSLRSARR